MPDLTTDQNSFDQEMLDNYDFSDGIRGDPFKDKMKNGYSVLIRYGPKSDESTDMYIIDKAIDRLNYEVYEKMAEVPHEQIEEKLNKILEAVKNC